ncbi:MAG: oligosaccharide flippase family protein [Vicingus serpentipes]|nr:oligosaccharide flippase family protein [Vicingus serpentipes]
MQRKFITNLGLLLLLNFLIKPFWIFGIDRTVQNTVSVEDYGIYFALFNFSLLFNIVLDLGITTYNNRSIAQNTELLSKYFSGIIVFKLLLALIYFLITFIVGCLAGYDHTRFYILLFLSINQFLISFIQYLRSNVAGLQLFTLDSLLSVLDKSLMILFCGVLLWGNIVDIQFNLMHFIYAQTLAYGITGAIVFFIVLVRSKQFTFKIDFSFLWSIVKQTFPYAVLVLTMTFYYRMDAVMLDLMLDDGEKQASIYAQAYRLMDAFNQIGVLFAGLLLPMFAYMIKRNEKINELLQLAFSLLFIPAVVLAILSFFFSNTIMEALYKNSIQESAVILPILMMCFVAIATTYIYGTLLTANGSLLILNKLAIGGLLLNLVLNFILIPFYQGYGSAVASLITQLLVVISQIFYVRHLFKLDVNIRFGLMLILFVILVYLMVGAIKIYVNELVTQLVLSTIIAFLLGVALKLINLKKIYETLINKGE